MLVQFPCARAMLLRRTWLGGLLFFCFFSQPIDGDGKLPFTVSKTKFMFETIFLKLPRLLNWFIPRARRSQLPGELSVICLL